MDQSMLWRRLSAILGVEDESGQGYRFDKSVEDQKIRLKIGDPSTKITGIKTYIIKYKVLGAHLTVLF